jgi:hypothetical protein
MTASLRDTVWVALVAALWLAPTVFAQDAGQTLQIPGIAELEGMPRVRVDSSDVATTRRPVEPAEATRSLLRIRVRDGRYFWASRNDAPLRVTSAGAFTYLTAEPGSYIRLTRLNDTIAYVEHVDLKERGSVTWWGELRIVLPK